MITVVTTVDRKEVLDRIGKVLLEKRLIACIQISGPISSIYWWKGSIQEAQEWVGAMKTRKELYPEVEKELRLLHTYEIPEIVAVEATETLSDYEEWIRLETGG